MTMPVASSPRPPWYLRPGRVLPLLGIVVCGGALLTPEPTSGRAGDSRLTTFSSGPQGAAGVYAIAQRLGWKVERNVGATAGAVDGSTVAAVLAPVEPLSAAEAHLVLETVRRGGALLLVLPSGSLDDSLHVRPGRAGVFGGRLRDPSCPTDVPSGLSLWPASDALLNSLRAPMRPPARDTFATIEVGAPSVRRVPSALGIAYGHGRIAIAADPDLLRNDVVRDCRLGADTAFVRMLEFLSGGASEPRRRVVFDEYHQGEGVHPGTMRAIALYFETTRSGHLFGQLILAGGVLLLAVGPRALVPQDVERVERRSPLEHVEALARAYAQVGATRTAAGGLLRGVRRRTHRARLSVGADQSDRVFLDSVARAMPSLATDVAIIRRALDVGISRRDFEALGTALRELESSLALKAT